MPQATEELRKEWGGIKGVGEDKAMDYLQQFGWRLTGDWRWEKPYPTYQPTQKELDAIQFLIEEWDFGGIIN